MLLRRTCFLSQVDSTVLIKIQTQTLVCTTESEVVRADNLLLRSPQPVIELKNSKYQLPYKLNNYKQLIQLSKVEKQLNNSLYKHLRADTLKKFTVLINGYKKRQTLKCFVQNNQKMFLRKRHCIYTCIYLQFVSILNVFINVSNFLFCKYVS